MYKSIKILINNAIILSNSSGWEWICENHHGECYWNEKTGELLWIPNDEKYARYQKLI